MEKRRFGEYKVFIDGEAEYCGNCSYVGCYNKCGKKRDNCYLFDRFLDNPKCNTTRCILFDRFLDKVGNSVKRCPKCIAVERDLMEFGFYEELEIDLQ